MVFIRKKLVIAGDGGCGKTSLLMVFAKKDKLTTVYDPFVVNIEVDAKQVEMALCDTVVTEGYDRFRPLTYIQADVLLLCFLINYPYTFINIHKKWAPEVKHFCPNVPIILVGNKSDLRNDEETISQLKKFKQTPVAFKQGQQMAKRINAFAYLECSSKTKEGVQTLFETAASAALKVVKKKNYCVVL